jgi:hypothetical protein
MDKSIPEADAEAIRQSIFAGHKIEAIRRLRASTDLDLHGAKKMVEQLEQELRSTSPEKFTATGGKGCSTRAAALALAVAIGIAWVIMA